jgi:hypothetical protein
MSHAADSFFTSVLPFPSLRSAIAPQATLAEQLNERTAARGAMIEFVQAGLFVATAALPFVAGWLVFGGL